MSTNSSISFVLPTGEIRTTYCHFDGYLMGVGRTLLEFYNTRELADKITSMGDISILGQRIDPIGEHSFDDPESDTCVFYGRDRGDKGTEPKIIHSLPKYYSGCRYEYNYVYVDGGWHVIMGEGNHLKKLRFNAHRTKVYAE